MEDKKVEVEGGNCDIKNPVLVINESGKRIHFSDDDNSHWYLDNEQEMEVRSGVLIIEEVSK